MTSWRQFKSDCHQTWSVNCLAIGDEVIKFSKVKVKVGGEVCTLLKALLVQFVMTAAWCAVCVLTGFV